MGKTVQAARRVAEAAAVAVRAARGELVLVGPSPAPISRMRDRIRWQMLLKGPTPRALEPAERAMEDAIAKLPSGVKAVLDVDPIDLL